MNNSPALGYLDRLFCNIYVVQQDTQCGLNDWVYSPRVLARHVSDLIVLPHTKVCEYSLYKTLLMMDRWGPKHVLTYVMNKLIIKTTLCILLDCIYVTRWYTVPTMSRLLSFISAWKTGSQTAVPYRRSRGTATVLICSCRLYHGWRRSPCTPLAACSRRHPGWCIACWNCRL